MHCRKLAGKLKLRSQIGGLGAVLFCLSSPPVMPFHMIGFLLNYDILSEKGSHKGIT